MNTKTFGYVRVSTADQNVERQLSKMRELGIGVVQFDSDMSKAFSKEAHDE